MLRGPRRSIASVGAALAVTLLSLTGANAGSASDNTPNWDQVCAQVVGDQTALKENDWRDFSALGYAKPKRSDAAAVQWFPQQPLPAVDGINGTISGFGGGEKGSNGVYGGGASLSIPVAQQWGLQLDGFSESEKGHGTNGGTAQLFWRDPSIGLLGAYVSYERANGPVSANVQQYAGEGELYLSRWTLGGLVGVDKISVNSGGPLPSPTRFFDEVRASYYATDNFQLHAGHVYTIGTHFLTLGTEYGVPLGGGRMASLFADGWIGEHGNNGARAGLRVYFGQHDKSLIERHRQDDPFWFGTPLAAIAWLGLVAGGAIDPCAGIRRDCIPRF
jgi:hypothetical protein